MPFFKIPGKNVLMYYVVNSLRDDDSHYIDPAKPCLVLIHAYFSSVDNYQAQFSDKRLTNAYNLIAFDCRFHGKTTGPEIDHYNLDDASNSIGLAIGILNIKTYAVIGETCLGAFIGSYLALKHPEQVKGLFLASPGYQEEPQSLIDMLFDEWLPFALTNKDDGGDGHLPPEALSFFSDYFFSGDPRTADRYKKYTEYFQWRYGTGHNIHDCLHVLNFHKRKAIPLERLATIQCPVILLQGGNDNRTSPLEATQSWKDAFKNARGGCDLRVLTDAPNMLMYTDPNIANRFILQFMGRLDWGK